MRALLINPWIYDFAAYDLWSKPLGLLTIANVLKRSGWEVSLLDLLDRSSQGLPSAAEHRYGSGFYHAEIVEKPAILKRVSRHYKRYGLPQEAACSFLKAESRPDIILVTSGMTYWYPGVAAAITMAREAFPGVPIVLGGVYANLCYKHAKAQSGADYVYRGSSLREIAELIGRVTGFANTFSDIDEGNVIPAYELYKNLGYITIRTSTGCPFKCSYCGWYLLGKKFARQTPLFVAGYIEDLHRRFGVKDFAFYDDALLYEAPGHIVPILGMLLRKDLLLRFHTPNGLHARFMTGSIAGLLKRAGFIGPRLALETVSAERQAMTGEKTTTDDFVRAVDHLTSAGYFAREIGVNILIGLPGQSADEIEASIRFAAAHQVKIHLEEYSPIPGTPEYERSGLAPDADPLLHNNSIFALHDAAAIKRFQELKALTQQLNKKA